VVWVWVTSFLPNSYGVGDMGYVDLGGGPEVAVGHHGEPVPGGVSVEALAVDAERPPDVTVPLIARQETFRLASGEEVKGYTLNGTSPGPLIEAQRGELVEVRLRNESVAGGMTLHWHGLDVPNGTDGVAGVTQDAVPVQGEYRYRFVAEQVGTFWYHSHQVSHEQVRRGLFGALVIRDPEQQSRADGPVADVTALVHQYGSVRTVNGHARKDRHDLAPGTTTRIRVINTENGAIRVAVRGAPFRLLAVDGTDLVQPESITNEYVLVTAGARADLEIVTPVDGSAVQVTLGGDALLELGPPGSEPDAWPDPEKPLDLLTYGSSVDLGALAEEPDRDFEYRIGTRFGLLNGRPGAWWTVNGHLYPNVPMFTVAEGDIVRMTIVNNSGDSHPMHLHGHHAVVLSRDGDPATGSPWWVDSLHVADGETYEIAFVADNPGIWMDHCHNLRHPREGLVAHLMYEGVSTPFVIGGPGKNVPE
jgi:FtsP/CotA-like multicopper oxidase with cupredoxin domain